MNIIKASCKDSSDTILVRTDSKVLEISHFHDLLISETILDCPVS